VGGSSPEQLAVSEREVDTRSRRLRALGTPAEAPGAAPVRHPRWIRMKLPTTDSFFDLRRRVHGLGLHTVCESASCPNIGECWSRRSLTVMILGGICTRSCQFCDVPTGRPEPPDPGEPERVAEMLASLETVHAVLTCVDRDDLPDGGAAHWAATIGAIRQRSPRTTVEALTGDFRGDLGAVDVVLGARPDVFAHNLETVPRLAREVRVQASFERSLAVLGHAHRRGAVTKTGLMLGLGESLAEVREVLAEIARLGLNVVTLGQYLRPSRAHLPVARYLPPEEFDLLGAEARALGIAHVESGPLVRSSYRASVPTPAMEQKHEEVEEGT
jgi:lipoyl synthase